MIKPEDYINFNGQDWNALKMWAERKKEIKIGLLVQADSHDKSNKIRGELSFITELLALEHAARKAAGE